MGIQIYKVQQVVSTDCADVDKNFSMQCEWADVVLTHPSLEVCIDSLAADELMQVVRTGFPRSEQEC